MVVWKGALAIYGALGGFFAGEPVEELAPPSAAAPEPTVEQDELRTNTGDEPGASTAAADTPEPLAAPAPSPPRFVEPVRIRGRDRRPAGRTTQRFTDRPPLVRPALRVAPGFSARLTGRPYAAFGLDVLASVMMGVHGGYRQWGLAPEVGYSLRAPGMDHQVVAGVGLLNGVNAEITTFGWLPRVVLQPQGDALMLGVRNGLWFDFAENGFSVELGHQWMPTPGRDIHELRLTLGIDLAMLAFVLSKTRMAWL